MTPETRIARHHLGDALLSVYRGGPYADQWTVQTGAPSVGIPGGLFTAATVEEAAQAAAAQLRAGGWVPTHARLVWAFKLNRAGDCALQLHTDQIALEVGRLHLWTPEQTKTIAPGWAARTYSHKVPGPDPLSVTGLATMEEAAGKVAEWVTTNLPSLHLPPFPGASDAI